MIGWMACRLGLHKWAGPPENRYCVRCGRAHPKVEEHLQRLLEEKKREARARLRAGGFEEHLQRLLEGKKREARTRGSGHADEGNPRGPSS
jgi:hypothetical protein